MDWLGEVWRRLLYPFRRRQFDRDLEEEMRFHLEMKAQNAGSTGARKQFGNVARLQEQSRDAWGWTAVEAWLADLRYALRGLRKNPGFAAVAILTMALGIGSMTAIFSVVHSVLVRPLPFRDPDRLAMVWQTDARSREDRGVVSYPQFREWKDRTQSFEHLAAWDGNSATMMAGSEPTDVPGADVSPGFFEALGTPPMIGRGFRPEEHWRSAPKTVLLSYALWQRLGGDPRIATVQFGAQTFTVAGVMPKGFAYPEGWSELWFPHAADDSRNDGARYLKVIGRLKAGVTLARADAGLEGASVVSLQEETVGRTRRVLLVLLGAVFCVLLIACANVANLLLVRATARRHDLALRLSLGASRWRIARGLLAESVLLAAAGGAAGVAAAYWIVRVFVAADPVHLPRIHEVAVNGTVLAYAAAATIFTGLAFGLAPALRGTRPELAATLKERRANSRSFLATAQIALAVMLLVGAGLLARSFVAQIRVPLGFETRGAIGVSLPWSANRGINDLLERLRALPGVTAAGAATAFPQNAPPLSCTGCVTVDAREQKEKTGLFSTTSGYFEAAGLRLVAGRFFTAGDGPETQKVAVVNQAFARREFPGRDPVGQSFRSGDRQITIVGVVGNVKGFGVAGDPDAAIYFPHRQYGWYNPVSLVVRTAVPPASLTAAVRKQVRDWKPTLVIKKIDTMDNLMASSVATPRFYLVLMASFAALALAVSAVGVYGTVNYSVTRRLHEIGIRIALGAARGDVLTMVLKQGLALTAAGVAAGLVGAWAAARVLESLLFGVRPTDGIAFACGSGVLVAAALLACYLPARRATRVDPLLTLRHE